MQPPAMFDQQDNQIAAATDRVARWYDRQPLAPRVLLGTALFVVWAAIMWSEIHDRLRFIGP